MEILFIVNTIVCNKLFMKGSYIIILALFCFASCKTNRPVSSAVNKAAELPSANTVASPNQLVSDTLGYVNDIVANRDKYINKELSVLINDLKVPVKSYAIINSRPTYVEGIRVSFDDRVTTIRKQAQDDETKKAGILNIMWKIPIPAEKHKEIMEKSTSKGEWQSAEQEFYSKQIIRDIY
jgi:hypothetical protein